VQAFRAELCQQLQRPGAATTDIESDRLARHELLQERPVRPTCASSDQEVLNVVPMSGWSGSSTPSPQPSSFGTRQEGANMTETQRLTDEPQPTSGAHDHALLQREIANRLAIVNKHARRYRVQNTVLVVIGLVFGLIATTLAGSAAIGDETIAPTVAQAMTGKEPSPLALGWRAVCGVVAVCSFIGATANGLTNILKVTEHRSKAFICAGTLDALLADVYLDPKPDAATVARVRSDLAKLIRDYPEYLR